MEVHWFTSWWMTMSSKWRSNYTFDKSSPEKWNKTLSIGKHETTVLRRQEENTWRKCSFICVAWKGRALSFTSLHMCHPVKSLFVKIHVDIYAKLHKITLWKSSSQPKQDFPQNSELVYRVSRDESLEFLLLQNISSNYDFCDRLCSTVSRYGLKCIE